MNDIILIQSKAETKSLAAPSTPMKGEANVLTNTPKRPVRIYSESTISVEVPNESVPNGKICVSGRADWTIGYGSKDVDGA